MAISNSYVKLPEGIFLFAQNFLGGFRYIQHEERLLKKNNYQLGGVEVQCQVATCPCYPCMVYMFWPRKAHIAEQEHTSRMPSRIAGVFANHRLCRP